MILKKGFIVYAGFLYLIYVISLTSCGKVKIPEEEKFSINEEVLETNSKNITPPLATKDSYEHPELNTEAFPIQTSSRRAPIISDSYTPPELTNEVIQEPNNSPESVDAPEISEERGDILHRDAVYYARRGDFGRALELIIEARDETDNVPEVVGDHIVILAWAGKHEDAINEYEGLLPTYSPSEYVTPELARSYRVIGEYDKAINLYKEHLNLKPEDKEATKGLIYTYLDNNQLDSAKQYINERLERDEKEAEWLELYLADILLSENMASDAEPVYTQAHERDPNNMHAQLGLGKILIMKKEHQKAEPIIDKILEKDPKNVDALFSKGEILEGRREYISAYRHYEKILRIYPDSQAALNLKYRVLMHMGANSLARKRLEDSGDKIDKGVSQILWGNEAMARIKWEEPGVALEVLERNRECAESQAEEENLPDQNTKKFLFRTSYDRILALNEKNAMDNVIKEYENLSEQSIELPPWVLTASADSYLYNEEPEAALKLYNSALEQGWDPEYGSTRMSIYHTLVELGRYREAGKILDELDSEMSVEVIDRGIWRKNWWKEEVSYNRGWWYIYQDRLAEGQEYLAELRNQAPRNTHIHTALAHTYLWRGWPRLALEEFEIINNIETEDIAAKNGYYYALNENDQGEKARYLAKGLLQRLPDDRHVKMLNQYLKVQDMRTITIDGGVIQEDPGIEGTYWTVRIDQPILPWRKVFTEFNWQDISQDALEEDLRRGSIGLDWRLNRDLWFTGSMSVNEGGNDFGYRGELTLDLNDNFSFKGLYDSYSLALPFQARVYGIDTKEARFTALYRHSDIFSSRGEVSFFKMSDDNKQWAYMANLDRAITTRAYWKTRLGIEGFAISHSKTDVPYYSPEYLYSAYLIPMVEHAWYKRYDSSLLHRLYFGIGNKWEKEFSSQGVWYVRYEHDYKFSQDFNLMIGAIYSKEDYYGEDTDVWHFYTTFKKHF